MRFTPGWRVAGQLAARTQDEIRAEPMVFACDFRHAQEYGGPITREFLGLLALSDWVIDSKTVMLMPGFWPCIPGWHHDDVPRTRRDGQPDYNAGGPAEHTMAFVGDASRTEFIAATVDVPEIPLGRTVYKAWDRYLEALAPPTAFIEERAVVRFDANDFHRGTAATKSGWRFFIRASRYTTRKPANERRTQVQVYLSDPSEGW